MQAGPRAADERPTLSAVLRTRPFAVLFWAETQSVVGDQLARVALSILVFRRTGSSAATALTYALTYLPAILGGVVLAGIGDRLPRRAVMIGCDLVRAGLFAAMAIPQLPIWVVACLLVVAVFLGPAFSAAEVSYLAAALEREQFRVGTGLRMISSQVCQVLGFAVGGVLVEELGPRGSLLVDASTYAVSAVLIAAVLRSRVPGRSSADEKAPPARPAGHREFAGLWRDPNTRALMALIALAGFFIVPEGLAVPFGADAGADPAQIGLLLASIPLGGALGAAFLVRRVAPRHRPGVARWMAVGCGLPLGLSGLIDSWPLAVGCWLVSGALAAYQVEATAALVHLFPAERRARLVGVASSVLLGAQGVGLVVFAGVARFTTAGVALASAGLAGSAIAVVLLASHPRSIGVAAPRHAYRAQP